MQGIFGSILGSMGNELAGYLRAIAPVLILLGFGWGLFGYRIYRITLFVVGFVIGFLIGAAIGYGMGQTGGTIVVGLIVGVIFGFLSMFLAKVSVFLIGFAVGVILAILLAALGRSGSVAVVLGLVLGIVGGIVALKLHKLFIILGSSIVGSLLVTTYLPAVAVVHAAPYVWPVVGVVLVVAFVVFQYTNTHGVDYDISGRPVQSQIPPVPLATSGDGPVTSQPITASTASNEIAIENDEWTCPECGKTNDRNDLSCRGCGYYR